MKKALHIVVDEKFIDGAITIFSQTSVLDNRFYCINTNNAIKHIKQLDKITFVKNELDLIDIINSKFDIVFLHSLCISPDYLLKIKKNIKIVWITWGYDIYSDKGFLWNPHNLIHINLYKPLTWKYIYRNHYIIKLLSNVKSFVKNIIKGNPYKQFSKRVDYISTILSIEFEIIKSYNPKIKALPFLFHYISNDFFQTNESIGNNILIGNSAFVTNNHLDILNCLQKFEFNDRKLIMPLNYGDLNYRDYILNYCEKNNLSYCKPIIDFMPFEEYAALLNSCDYAIFGVLRQQAMGNIFIMLTKGTKVFLYKDSIVFKYLKQQGYIIFSIDEDLNNQTLNTPLSMNEKSHNKKLILQQYDYDEYINLLNNELNKC